MVMWMQSNLMQSSGNPGWIILVSGLAGALITASVTLYIYLKSRKPPSGRAHEVLKGLGKVLNGPEGEYVISTSSKDNFHAANHIYNHADQEIIATNFYEDPSVHGVRNLARAFKYGGSLFTRITNEEVCGDKSAEKAREHLAKILKGATLVIIPKGVHFTMIDGIFCKFRDETHLCFISFRDPARPQENNRGVIFRDGIARTFFEYYKDLSKKYSTP